MSQRCDRSGSIQIVPVVLAVVTCALCVTIHQSAKAQTNAGDLPATTTSGSATDVPPAGSGQVLVAGKVYASLPPERDKIRGFTIDVVADGSGAVGYLPVRLHVKSTSTFSADRNLVVRFQPVELGQSPPQAGITCDIRLRAPQGAKDVVVLGHLPKWSVGTAYQIRVFEDGVELEDYQQEIGTLLSRRSRPPMELLQRELTLDWLHVSLGEEPGFADSSPLQLETALVNQSTWNNNSSRAIVELRRTLSVLPASIARVSPADLSADWRQFQAFDGVLLTRKSLATLAGKYPRRLQALRDWVMAGGTVVVLDAQSPAATLSVLKFQSHPVYAESSRIRSLAKTAAAVQRGQIESFETTAAALRSIADGAPNAYALANLVRLTPVQALDDLKRVKAQLESLRKSPGQTDRVWSQPVAAGRVIGITGTAATSSLEWRVVTGLFGYRRSATLRRGVDPMLGDPRVRRWLIPGVAQPPVYTFMGLLAVFVVLVGPVAYRKTTRVGRGYLMFAIAPALALMTTLAMFGYGVVADGFGTTTRIRQLTWVDGHSGDATERVRSTYFAGVRPSEGLRFAADAEVMGYPDYDGETWEELHDKSFAISGKVTTLENAQLFDSSFLPSRAQRQFIIHQPRHQLGKLTFHPPVSSDPEASPALENGFDFPLRKVIVRDKDGVYWTNDKLVISDQTGMYWTNSQLESGEMTGSCLRLVNENASKLMGDLYNQNRPLAAVRQTRTYSSYDRRIRDLIITLNRSLGDTSQVITDGIFETYLQQKLQVDNELPLRTFIAEADVSEDVIAVKDAELVESIRYVFGTLP